nr:hypothetical protein 398p2_00110 [Serratia entomophila]
MAVKVGIRDDGGEIGGVRQRGYFVAKVSPRNYCAGGSSQGHIQAGCDAHQGDTYGACRPPGGASTHGDHTGNKERGDQDILRTDQL